MPKIDRLSHAQIARFPEFIDRWTKIGLCTDPADRPTAEEGIREAYQIAGKTPPEKIVWCGSPLSMGLTRAIIFGLKGDAEAKLSASVRASVRASVCASVYASVRASVRDSVCASVYASVRASVRDSVCASVYASVRASVRDSVCASVYASVRASVRDSVRASVRDSVSDSVCASVYASVRDSVRDSVYGQHEASWLAFCEYFRDACGLSEETQRLCGLLKVARAANWWLPHEKTCWISDRHNILNRDDRGRLHCVDGPALAYPDGWQIWSIGGVRVDEQVVMRPETQTLDQINSEQNEEIKRIRIERFGWEPYLSVSNAQVLDSRRNDVECTRESLMRVQDMTVLVCHCPSTARIYCLEVDPSCQTAEQAQRYLWSGSRHLQNRKLNLIGRS